MRCRDVHALESAYLDGELDEARSSAFRGHLRVCDACRDRLADLALLVETAGKLELVDPPPALWGAIEQRLAEAEIADARRSWLWLHWQALRPRLLPATVGLAAVLAVVLWLVREAHDRGEAPRHVRAKTSSVVVLALAEAARPKGTTFFEARGAELRAADERYRATIEELRHIVDEERVSWPAGLRAAYDARVGELEAAARRHEQALAMVHDPGPRERDALYAVYRAQIELMQQAAVDGLVLASAEPGGWR